MHASSLVLSYGLLAVLLADICIADVIIKNFFPVFFFMVKSFENLNDILPDWRTKI